MKYYALVNTASPQTGFISVGEVLTDKAVRALGEEKLAELVRERVLAAMPGEADSEGTPEEAAETDAEDADGLPELELAEDVDSDADVPAEKPKKNGRRKAK